MSAAQQTSNNIDQGEVSPNLSRASIVPQQQVAPTPQVAQVSAGQPAQVSQISDSDDGVVTVARAQSSQDDSAIAEIVSLQHKVENANLPPDLKIKADQMISRLRRMAERGSYSAEFEPVEKYINWIAQIPFGKYTSDNLDLAHVKGGLDSTHFGLEKIKEKILEYIAVIKLQNEGILKAQQETTGDTSQKMSELRGNSAGAPVILFVGVQGIGKTSITKSIANALGRKMVRIPLGALADAALIKGRPKGYPDAEPGLITKALIRFWGNESANTA